MKTYFLLLGFITSITLFLLSITIFAGSYIVFSSFLWMISGVYFGDKLFGEKVYK